MVHAPEVLESPLLRTRSGLAIAKSNNYHHGNLREALIAAAFDMLENSGVESLTLRSVAKQINVSHSAPYHHFGNKAHLLAAVADSGFQQMAEAIRQEAARNESPSGYSRLRSVMTGYFRFALARPSLFRLMFRPEMTRPDHYPFLAEAEAKTFSVLVETVLACQEEGSIVDCDPMPFAAFTWSTIHGLATLCIDRAILGTPLREMPVEVLLNETVDRVMNGMGATPPGE